MNRVDLVLSSGFLAFAEHTGFLAGVEEAGLEVQGLCGTSSGALVGALWLSGMTARQVLEETTRTVPLGQLSLNLRVWEGLFTMGAVVEQLRQHLPPRFRDLELPLGVGLTSPLGDPVLMTRGPLPEAVAASCAVPTVSTPVVIGGIPYSDGGSADRLFLDPWREYRPCDHYLVHLVERSLGKPGEPDLSQVTVVRSPRSGAQLWHLGDVAARFERSRQLTLRAVEAMVDF